MLSSDPSSEPILTLRDCEAVQIPSGLRFILPKDTEVRITQVLGGSFTVAYIGGLARVDGKDADALGQTLTPSFKPAAPYRERTQEELEQEVWNQLRQCFDPEIPVNIVDLGLIYECKIAPRTEGPGHKAEIKMTLTAPGCGMGEILKQDVDNKVRCIEGIEDANVELVWEPPWNQGLMTDAARLQLGLM